MTFGMTMLTLDLKSKRGSTRRSKCCTHNQASERGTRSRPLWWCVVDRLGIRWDL